MATMTTTMTTIPTRMRRRRRRSGLLLAAAAVLTFAAASAATVRGVRSSRRGGGGHRRQHRHLESSSSSSSSSSSAPTSYFPSSAPPVASSSSPLSVVVPGDNEDDDDDDDDEDDGDDDDADDAEAMDELKLNCPPNFVGYVATPDCTGYYKCKHTKSSTPTRQSQLSQRRRRRMTMIKKSCIDGLLFDSTLQICTWAEDVTCDNNNSNNDTFNEIKKKEKKQTEVQDDLSASSSSTLTKTEEEGDDDDKGEVSNLQTRTKVVPYSDDTADINMEKEEEKEKPIQVIGYWRGSSSLSSSSSSAIPPIDASTINYAKVTRINIATFTTTSTSTITMMPENPNDSLSTGSENDLIALLGPKVWDGSGVEYCLLSSTTCFQHDTTKGMIHLAHSSNVQIYASITLSPSILLGLNIGTFVTNAMSLLTTVNFDGLDIYITSSTTDRVNEDTNSIVMALQSLLMVLQPELLSLMDMNGRSYGLSLVVLPSCGIGDDDTITDESVYTQNFINILKSVGELNLLSYNPPTNDDNIVPTSSPILSWQQQPLSTTTINSITAIIDSSTITSNNDNCQAIEESVAIWGSQGVLPDKINVGLNSDEDVCEQVLYGISSGWNGYFLWDLSEASPLLDVIDSVLKGGSDYTCPSSSSTTSGLSSLSSSSSGISDDGETYILVNGTKIFGWYGPPRYYPVFGAQSCTDNDSDRPMWVSDDHLYKSKEECCIDTFRWIDIGTCLGQDFVETNFFTERPTMSPTVIPTLSPSLMPTFGPTMAPSTMPSDSPSDMPSSIPSMIPSTLPSYPPSSFPTTYTPSSPPSIMPTTSLPTTSIPTLIITGLPTTINTEIDDDDDEDRTDDQKIISSSSQQHDDEIQSMTTMMSSHVSYSNVRDESGEEGQYNILTIPADEDVTLSMIEDSEEVHAYLTTLTVDGSESSLSHVLLKFDLSFMESSNDGVLSFASVKLRLFLIDGSGFCGTFTVMDSTAWSEKSITHVNAPIELYEDNSYNSLVIGQAWDVSSGSWFELDVTGAAHWAYEENNSLSIQISSNVPNQCTYSSSNGPQSQAPYLLVELIESNDSDQDEEEEEEATVPPRTRPTTDNDDDDDDDDKSSRRPTKEDKDSAIDKTSAVSLLPTLSPSVLQGSDVPSFAPSSRPTLPSTSSLHPSSHPSSQPTISTTSSTPTVNKTILRATDDATIMKKEPFENFSTSPSLIIGGDGTAAATDILIRFDVSMIHRIPIKATLVMYAQQACNSAGIITTTQLDVDWTEDNVSWSNAPSYVADNADDGSGGQYIGSFGGVDGAKWTGVDVLLAFNDFRGQRSITFRVSSDGGHQCNYASIQGGKAAKLQLEF